MQVDVFLRRNKFGSIDSRTGLSNVRPAGHMRPAKHLNVALEHFLGLGRQLVC